MRIGLNGAVVTNDTAMIYRWYGFTVCCPKDIKDALETCPEGEELVLEINSGGGSVYAGFEMYTALRAAGRPVIGEIQSVAASAASVIAAGCSTVRISPIANVMIHRASAWASGNSEDMGQTKQMLDTVDESILTAYQQKCGENASREELLEMMKNETFLTAQEAVRVGLADEIMFAGADEDSRLTQAAAAMAKSLETLDSLPDITELMRKGKAPNAEKSTKEEAKHMTLDELKATAPELITEISQNAAAAERQRIADIENVALPGFEDIVNAAKQDGNKTAESVAMEIVAAQKAAGNQFLTNRKKDVQDGNVDSAEPEDAGQGEDPNAELDAVLDELFGK